MHDWVLWAFALLFAVLVMAGASLGWALCYGKLVECRKGCEGLRTQMNFLRHGLVGDQRLSLGALREIERALRGSGLSERQAVELIVAGLRAWNATKQQG